MTGSGVGQSPEWKGEYRSVCRGVQGRGGAGGVGSRESAVPAAGAESQLGSQTLDSEQSQLGASGSVEIETLWLESSFQ